MAFTDAQKRDIRKYMGVPMGYYDISYRLESMMNVIGGNATDQAQVDEWLLRLAEIDTALIGASGGGSGSSTSTATYGSLKKVDEIEFYPVGEGESGGGGSAAATLTLIDQGRVLIARLTRALGCHDFLPIGDYFGTRRPISAPLNVV